MDFDKLENELREIFSDPITASTKAQEPNPDSEVCMACIRIEDAKQKRLGITERTSERRVCSECNEPIWVHKVTLSQDNQKFTFVCMQCVAQHITPEDIARIGILPGSAAAAVKDMAENKEE